MPYAHFMVGLPGSGKSTWVKKYSAGRNPPPVVLSTDAPIERYAAENGMTYDQAHRTVNHKDLGRNLMSELHAAVAADRDIIIDQTNMTVKLRRKRLAAIPDHYTKVAVVFVLPDNLLAQRLDARHRTDNKYIPASVVDHFASIYQPPTKAEGFDKIVRVTAYPGARGRS